MNIVKITKSLVKYLDVISTINIPDVYLCYKALGKEIMGREVWCFNELVDKEGRYFNKPIKHKSSMVYKGLPKEGYYSQPIVDFSEEERALCVKGQANKYQWLADKIINEFNKEFMDFVFDVGSVGKNKVLIELNELHLASLERHELDFVLGMILI